ncbi:MAG TPA: recombination mediator RecR [Polyangiaceae bacterium]|nr:recombination mediator RecR [Polyangiaceae bacterium]
MLPNRLRRIIELFARLPGVGEKTAQRFALHLLSGHEELVSELGRELSELKLHVRSCENCGNVAEIDEVGGARCPICLDSRRDARVLCIVARVQDLLAIERSGAMRGRYFVLGRLLSPLDGIGPDELPLPELGRRIESDGVEELILATPPSVDGEATALLLARELTGRGLRISRIASGVPHGGDLEFADQITLGRAIDGRRLVGDGR